MCGIVGSWGEENNYSFVREGLIALNSRGRDGCGVWTNNKSEFRNSPQELPETLSIETSSSIGHVLHSMVGSVAQPLSNKGVLVFNGEIYNWRELAKKYDLVVENDAQLLFKLLEKTSSPTLSNLHSLLHQVDGVYAFLYYRDSQIIFSRDLFGVKPLFYSINGHSLKISSEKKILEKNINEVKPGEIGIVNENDFSLNKKQIPFSLPVETQDDYLVCKKKVWNYFEEAIKKRIPENKKIGLLFSGGVDSTAIALTLKKLNVDFTCYTAKLEGGNIEEAQDLVYAKEIAHKYNLPLSISTIHVDDLKNSTLDVMGIIEDCDYIKTSVALPFYLCAKKAQQEEVDVFFSGVGAEELFAGYRRHKNTTFVNEECLKGLSLIHQRDLYRDDAITMACSIELRVPFLDKTLVEYSLSLPPEYKINSTHSKLIFRQAVAEYLNLKEEYAYRLKKAAQYGSKFDKGLLRLAKNAKMQKQEYLDFLWDSSFSKPRPKKVWY